MQQEQWIDSIQYLLTREDGRQLGTALSNLVKEKLAIGCTVLGPFAIVLLLWTYTHLDRRKRQE